MSDQPNPTSDEIMALADKYAEAEGALAYANNSASSEDVRDRDDAREALSTAIRSYAEEAVRMEREACASIALNACLVPPDGGSPTEEERLVCEEAARRIRSRLADDAQPKGP